MPKRMLGKTGVEVPILCLGGMFDTINNQLLLHQALNWGVTYWDTAEYYGHGLSEEGFGRFFARNPDRRKDVFLVTKLTPKEGNFAERFEKSLARLQTSYVDLFFVHGIDSMSQMTPEFRAWAAADEEGRQDQALRLQHAHQHGGPDCRPRPRRAAAANRRHHASPTTPA